LDEEGYVILKQLMPKEACEKMISELWERAKMWGIKVEDHTTWGVRLPSPSPLPDSWLKDLTGRGVCWII